jgi:hypothetical protein
VFVIKLNKQIFDFLIKANFLTGSNNKHAFRELLNPVMKLKDVSMAVQKFMMKTMNHLKIGKL